MPFYLLGIGPMAQSVSGESEPLALGQVEIGSFPSRPPWVAGIGEELERRAFEEGGNIVGLWHANEPSDVSYLIVESEIEQGFAAELATEAGVGLTAYRRIVLIAHR
jgi:hypothetical protein